MTKCTHGMPSPASCVDCMMEGNLPARIPEREMADYTYMAQFDGHCPVCDLPIRSGERLARTTRDRNVHERCV